MPIQSGALTNQAMVPASMRTLLSSYGALPAFLLFPFDLYYTGLIGNLVMFALGFLVGSILPPRHRNLENLTVRDQDSTPLS